MFDYGAVKNLEIYDSKIPPEYDLAKITASVFIYHGAKDTVVPLKVCPHLIH
jgi:predicted esterase